MEKRVSGAPREVGKFGLACLSGEPAEFGYTRRGAAMKKVSVGMLAAVCAVAVVSAMTYVSAQGRQGAAAAGGGETPQGRQGNPGMPRGEQIRHLVYIATP